MARTVKVGDKEYPVGRLTFAVMRDLEQHEDTLQNLHADVDGLDARLASVQAQLIELADEGKATEETVAPLVEDEKSLQRQRRALALAQAQARMAIVAVRLGVGADELAESLDLSELDRVEDEVSLPPTTGPGERG